MALLNPPVERLGLENALLSGRAAGRGHFVPPFAGPLSLKTVVQGEAMWETEDAAFRVDDGQALILNGGQTYTLTIEPKANVETLCAFFEEGFVEDALRSYVEAESRLLHEPERATPRVTFIETLRPLSPRLRADLLRLRDALASGHAASLGADEAFGRAAIELLDSESALRRRAAGVPAVRASTRAEMLRRLLRARDFIEAEMSGPLTLGRIARAACLSPFHCHRRFTAFFRETPHTYATRRRLERAEALLARSEKSVIDVCLEVGFTSPGSFTNLFQRRYAVSPTAYRRREKGKTR